MEPYSTDGMEEAKAFLRALATTGLSSVHGNFESEDDLMAAARRDGYRASLQSWREAVKILVVDKCASSDPYRALRSPIESHPARLREWVYEVCDYEGDPAWSRDQDYRERVEHLLSMAGRRPATGIIQQLTEEQLNGVGWLPNPFGLWTAVGNTSSRKLINWSKIRSMNGW
jgi:hypothetical protein